MSNTQFVKTILVPQGAEYQAVYKGLSRVTDYKPTLVPIQMGIAPVMRSLQTLPQFPPVLVMGLCGSLNPRYRVGDVVFYENCVHPITDADPKTQACDRAFTQLLQSRLKHKSTLVNALTSDRVIHNVEEKRRLGQIYSCDVVDMEGWAVLQGLEPNVAVAMLRVISDDCEHNIPDISAAISPAGSLQIGQLAIAMLQQPRAASRLIRGSLQGLKILQEVTTALFG